MAIKAAILAAFIASSSATIEQHDTDQSWQIQEDKSAIVIRAYHKDSKTHVMIGCTAGSPTILMAHRADGEEGWNMNMKIDDGKATRYGVLTEDAPGIVFNQINTEKRDWKSMIEEMQNGKFLKVLTNFSNGSTLARYPLDAFNKKYKLWLDKCESRGWVF